MNSFIKKYSRNNIIISALLILLSIFLIAKPVESLNFIMILLGVILTVNGIVHVISYFNTPSEFKTLSFELVQGIICIVLGLVFIGQPELISSFLPFIIGAWIIVEGIVKLQLAFNVKEIENSNWGLLVLLAILTIGFGIMIINNPFGAALAITSITGIILLVNEIINIIEAIYMIRKF